MRAILRQIRISPKKLNLVAGLVRRLGAERGLEVLKYTPKKGAAILYKLLASAVSNAEANFGQKRNELLVSEIIVTAGPTYKRGQSHSKGRITPLLKRTSHVTLKLGVAGGEKKSEKKAEKA